MLFCFHQYLMELNTSQNNELLIYQLQKIRLVEAFYISL